MFGSLTSLDTFWSLVLTNAITIFKTLIKRADYLFPNCMAFQVFRLHLRVPETMRVPESMKLLCLWSPRMLFLKWFCLPFMDIRTVCIALN